MPRTTYIIFTGLNLRREDQSCRGGQHLCAYGSQGRDENISNLLGQPKLASCYPELFGGAANIPWRVQGRSDRDTAA